MGPPAEGQSRDTENVVMQDIRGNAVVVDVTSASEQVTDDQPLPNGAALAANQPAGLQGGGVAGCTREVDNGGEFTKFIKDIRSSVLAKHPNYEDILDGRPKQRDEEEERGRKHPVLAERMDAVGEQLATKWLLHVKVQVEVKGMSSTTTLAFRCDNVDVVGFKNHQNGVWYELGNERMLPVEECKSELLGWGNSYESILGATNVVEVLTKLTSANGRVLKLGKAFVAEAVGVLSSYDPEQVVDVDANNMSAQQALVGLMVMVRDSARMNYVLNAIAGGWATGMKPGSTKQLMTDYVYKYEVMSEALRQWKVRNYTSIPQWSYPKLLGDIYFVLKGNPLLGVVKFTIKGDDDGAGFKKIISNVRTILANHPNYEDILDGHTGSNLNSTTRDRLAELRAAEQKEGRKHPLLAKLRAAEQPARWLHVKLQVEVKGMSSTTTLAIRDDNVHVMGFKNHQNGVWYELGNVRMLPAEEYKSELLEWGNSYESILGATNAEEVVTKLTSAKLGRVDANNNTSQPEQLKLGKAFMTEAVRVLSSHPEQVEDANMSAQQALVGLMVMVRDSARMNDVLEDIADGWTTGTESTNKQLMTDYVYKYEEMSEALRQWKGRNYDSYDKEPHPYYSRLLSAIYLVLNEEYSMGDLLSFSYPEMLKVSFPEMFNVNVMSRVDVEVKLQQQQQQQRWTGKEEIYGKIVALASDKERHSAPFQVGSMLFIKCKQEDGLEGSDSSPVPLNGSEGSDSSLVPLDGYEGSDSSPVPLDGSEGSDSSLLVPLDRSVVAVPSGWVLHIKVGLHIFFPDNRETKTINATLKLDNGTTSQNETPLRGSGIEVKVNTTWSSPWWPIQEIDKQFCAQLSRPVEIQRAGHRCDIVYTIGDEMSYTEFIMALRRMLAYHPGQEDILDGHELLNLHSTREHPLLAEFEVHPKRWHHVKLQVMDSGQNTPTTTLVMRGDNLYILGFINNQGVLYKLIDEKKGREDEKHEKRKSMIPEDYYNPEKTECIDWGVSYPRLLGVVNPKDEEDKSLQVAEKLTGNLGKKSAEQAVRVLSCYPHKLADDTYPSPNVALARLIVMVGESARMKPIHNSIAAGWSTGAPFSKETVKNYLWNWKNMSNKLREWKADGYDQRRHYPISAEVQAIYLVLRTRVDTKKPGKQPSRPGDGHDDDTHGKKPGKQPRRPSDGHDDTHGSQQGSGQQDSGPSNQQGSGPTNQQGSGSGSSRHSQHQASGSGSSGSSPHQASGPNQPPDGKQCREVDVVQVHGRPRVELLTIRANLHVVGTTITVFDGKRGQVIYMMEEQGEQEMEKGQGEQEVEKAQKEQEKMPELDLIGPYTGISTAYGCFEIQIDIPGHLGSPIRWEWDCEDESNAGQVDALEQPSHHTIYIQDEVPLAKITYAVMSNAREATVQVKLRRRKKGQKLHVVSADIRARINGFKDHKSILLRGKGAVDHPSRDDDPWCRLELARNVVAVPCGKALHIEAVVDLNIEDGDVKDNIVIVSGLEFINGICSKKIDNSTEVEVGVEVTWYPEVGRQPDVVYTIGDEQSFTGFINYLRGRLAEHEDREDIKGSKVLAKQSAEQPARWLHVKLQAVVEGEETSWMTLIMRDDDLCVHGFMDQKGFCYELLENKDSSVNMLPENVYSPQPLFWGLNYSTILQVQGDSETAAKKLESEGLGKSFAIKAVRRLSSSFHPDDEQDRLALAGLMVMVCESAKFNPVCDDLVDGWSNGTGRFTEELYGYVQKHEEMSWELHAWKSRRRLKERPDSMIRDMLEDTCLVVNTRKPKVTSREERDVLVSYDEWHNKIWLELLSIRADLGVVGTKIIIFDGKRGQIIYRLEEQRETGTMVDLALSRPYTAISPYGCFAIKIDIPGAAPIKWERDPEYAIKIDEPVTQPIDTKDGKRIAEVTYAVMSDPLQATVQFKLRLNDGHIPSGISGEISTLIEGFQDKDRPSILFRHANKRTAGQCISSTDDSMFLLQLARNAVAVPPKKVLLIKVDLLEIETSNNQEGVKPLNFKADLRIENGLLSQHHVVDGFEVEVNFTWCPEYGIEKIKESYDGLHDIPEDRKRYLPKAGEIGPPHVCEVVYTIGDDKSYARFIEALRRILRDYQNRDDGILLLSQQEMWLHVKLQVAGEEETPTTTLLIEYGTLYIHGFMNQSAVWCLDEFTPYVGGWRVRKDAAYSPTFTYKGNTTRSPHVVDRLKGSAILVGKSSAENAVRVLSRFKDFNHMKDDDTIWRALATLKAMVCDSAKINPVHGAIKDGWNNEMRLTKTKELIDYINNWERISGALLQWSAWEEDQELERIGIKTPGDPGRVIHLCCPFTPEGIYEPKRLAKAAARDNQTVHSLFGSPTRDYLISNKGEKTMPISDLEGKYVCVYSVENGYPPLNDFTAVLAKIYDKLKKEGEKFEVVAVPSDNNESSFNESFAKMPWLAIPPGDPMCMKLVRYFWLIPLRTLVLIGPDGKTLDNNIADIIQDYGFEAWEGFPFTYEKLRILAEKKAKAKAGWQSLLVRGALDFVIDNDGVKVPVSNLVGKTVLLYFSAQWCPGSRDFLPLLIREYNKIKEKNSDFEVVLISNDRDRSSFEEHFFLMPWLALPFGDERNTFLTETFRIHEIPSLVAIGPTGKAVSYDAMDQLRFHGADAFPFTEERLKELQKKLDEMAKGWPQKRDDSGFDLHPKCALGDEEKKAEEGETS